MLRYNWIVKSKGRQHEIQLQMDTIGRLFGTGSGRLVLNGTTVRKWGCNPFRMIPKGSCEFEIDGRGAYIRSRFTTKGLFSLVLDEKEIPPIEYMQRRAKAELKR